MYDELKKVEDTSENDYVYLLRSTQRGAAWHGDKCYEGWWRHPRNLERYCPNCEDIHHGHVQQCHEPAGNSPGTKSTQRRSTRPLRKVSFSQSGSTPIRPDLNNFSTWLLRPSRPGPYTMAHAACFDSAQAFAAGRQTRTILTFWPAQDQPSKAVPRSLKSL